MTEPLIVQVRPAAAPMGREEARRCIERVKNHLADARSALLELYERQGWRALGYTTWRDCAQAELGLAQTQVYNLLTAAEVERDVFSTRVENTPVPTKVLLPLADLDTAQERREVYEAAVTEAGGEVPTAQRVADLVAKARAGLPPGEAARLVREEEARVLDRQKTRQAEEAETDRASDLARCRTRVGQARKIALRLGLSGAAAKLAEALELL